MATRADGKTCSGPPVNLNCATLEEIAALPNVGPERAEQLLKNRPFRDWEDVGRVPGFEGLVEELSRGGASVDAPDVTTT